MSDRVAGRASAIEEHVLRNEDRVGKGLEPLPRRQATVRSPEREREFQRDKALRNPDWSDATHTSKIIDAERYEEHFSRDYVPGGYYRPKILQAELKAANENERKADWPVFAEGWNGTLLAGSDKTETDLLNSTAIWLLREIRRLTELTGQQEKHDQTGSYDGFGHDSLRDMGPTPEMLISKWIGSDVRPAPDGKKLKCIPRVTSKEVKKEWKARTGAVVEKSWAAGEVNIQSSRFLTNHVAYVGTSQEVITNGYYPRSVGDVQFNSTSQQTKFCGGVDRNGEKKWFPFADRTRVSKGNAKFQKDIRALSKNMADERAEYLTTDASLPYSSEFLAGKTEPKYSEKPALDDTRGFRADLDPDGENTFDRKPQSPHDAFVTERAASEAADYAFDELERYRRIMTDIPYEAFVDAAMGMRLDECGDGPRGNKQASARGRDRIKIAVTNFLRAEYVVEPLQFEVAA